MKWTTEDACAVAGIAFMLLAVVQPWPIPEPNAAFAFGMGLSASTALKFCSQYFR